MLRVGILLLLLFGISLLAASSATAEEPVTCSGIVPMKERHDRVSITDFGGVGDGKTVNTNAFREAIYRIQRLRRKGGTILYIPPGVYLTGSFNLTSHMTLYLANGAVIKAIQDASDWLVVDPLPSYGRGRELPGARYGAFILGYGLRDVIITGENGTIDGQGSTWWNMWRQKTLQYTRPHLIEFMYSRHILISNVTLKDSPFWNIHPVYCSNVVVHYATILAPPDSPNTDGVDPDSSCNVCIEDSYISTGDDLVAVKSGWDEYGIAFGRPSTNITVRRITGSTPFAGVAIGSESSGGVKNVLIEHMNISNVGIGIHIKTNTGRGGTVSNIMITDIYMDTARKGIKISGNVGDHPDQNFDPNATPIIKGVSMKNIRGVKVLQPGLITGIENAPFTDICLSDVALSGPRDTRGAPWECSYVKGSAIKVSPSPCSELVDAQNTSSCFTYL